MRCTAEAEKPPPIREVVRARAAIEEAVAPVTALVVLGAMSANCAFVSATIPYARKDSSCNSANLPGAQEL